MASQLWQSVGMTCLLDISSDVIGVILDTS